MSSWALLISCFFVVLSLHLSSGWFLPWWGTRCYEPIGCFPVSYPYNNSAGIAPESPRQQTIRFHFLRQGHRRRIFSLKSARRVLSNAYNPSLKSVVLIHGFFESVTRSWNEEMVQALFARGEEINVICVDWKRGAYNLLYYQSVANTRVVGAILAKLLEEMVALGGDPSNFHLIGFSLGAHVAGYAGERLPGLGRITGLDPAGPGFRETTPAVRLDPSDATVVDVYHTDCDPLTGTGLLQPVGTTDFYLNQGMDQPGCDPGLVQRITALFRLGVNRDAWQRVIACSHTRAYLFYISTINNSCTFPIQSCPTQFSIFRYGCQPCRGNSCPKLGYDFQVTDDVTETGQIFNVETTALPPYCRDS